MGSCFSSCFKLVAGSTSSYEAIVDTRSDQRNFAQQDKPAVSVSSSSAQNRNGQQVERCVMIMNDLKVPCFNFYLLFICFMYKFNCYKLLKFTKAPVVNEIVSVNSQAPYQQQVPNQQQPNKTQVNRSGFFIKYELKEEIGVGSTSKCYRCCRKSDGQNFACKVIDKRQVEVKFTGLLDQFFVEINVRNS
jgi:hypothetical protein